MAVMLATYLFKGRGIKAGLPYCVAATIREALDRMRVHGGPLKISAVLISAET